MFISLSCKMQSGDVLRHSSWQRHHLLQQAASRISGSASTQLQIEKNRRSERSRDSADQSWEWCVSHHFGPQCISWDATLGLLCPQRAWIVYLPLEYPSSNCTTQAREHDYGRTSQLLPAHNKRLCRMRFTNRISAVPEVEDRERQDLRKNVA